MKQQNHTLWNASAAIAAVLAISAPPLAAQDAATPATAAPKASLFFPIKNAAAFLHGTLTDFAQVFFFYD